MDQKSTWLLRLIETLLKVFIDSMQFMNFSADALVKYLYDNDFKYLSQEFSGDLQKLLKQKCIYPYKYMNSFKRFFDDRLPDRREFYSSLKDKCVNEKDYFLAVNVCNMLEMKTIGDYNDIYLNRDVLLLADVFEKLIGGCFMNQIFIRPGLSWDAS